MKTFQYIGGITLVALFMGIFAYGSFALAATVMTPTPITAATTTIVKGSTMYVYSNVSDGDTCYAIISSNGLGGSNSSISCVKTDVPVAAVGHG